jgi:hypothetical protein
VAATAGAALTGFKLKTADRIGEPLASEVSDDGNPEIRACTPEEAIGVSALLGELGDRVSPQQAAKNIWQLGETGSDPIFLAVSQERVAGLACATAQEKAELSADLRGDGREPQLVRLRAPSRLHRIPGFEINDQELISLFSIRGAENKMAAPSHL